MISENLRSIIECVVTKEVGGNNNENNGAIAQEIEYKIKSLVNNVDLLKRMTNQGFENFI